MSDSSVLMPVALVVATVYAVYVAADASTTLMGVKESLTM